MRYEGTVYRPPSEADSLIIQTTIGCPHNRCRFCDMYRDKRFRIRKVDDIIEDINTAGRVYDPLTVRAVFLADGNSVIMRPAQLLDILAHLYKTFPKLKRVTSYGATQYLAEKSPDDLKALCAAGLTRIHCGMESGDDELLAYVGKGATAAVQIRGGQNVKAAGMEVSFYVMPGLGGKERSTAHALGSARVLSAVKPNFIRLRTFVPQLGTFMAEACLQGEYTLLGPHDTLREIRLMIENLDADGSQVVSDHWTNFAAVRGLLPHDKPAMLAVIDQALTVPEYHYREVGVYNGTL
ncbi:MAG: radical SAM protein [Deltaproteobacteria bacterium]|jgi:radical SAM superfamily enzyme YgiQ (UPF0313 family)|nr:radical SAM protein [Deltaproteobacteria bacterium]